jgi:hypothetical protein
VPVGIQPNRNSSFVQPFRDAQNRVQPAGRFTETSKNNFPVFLEVEMFKLPQNLFFRRFPGQAESVTVNTVTEIPDTEDATGAAPVRILR